MLYILYIPDELYILCFISLETPRASNCVGTKKKTYDKDNEVDSSIAHGECAELTYAGIEYADVNYLYVKMHI